MWTGGKRGHQAGIALVRDKADGAGVGNGKIRPSDANVGVEEHLAELPARLRGQRPEDGLDGLAVDRL